MIAYQLEPMTAVLPEIQPLLEKHWQEIAHFKDIPLSPNWPLYVGADQRGNLRIFTARIDGELVGYSVHFVGPGVHYSTSLQAQEDLVFVTPEHRKGRVGAGLIQFADSHLAAEGCQTCSRHVKTAPELDFGPLLERLGYEPVDRIFIKRLDKRVS
jgi:GNAT superfamily N-acetyltransferase